jgi:hypothetical protein
MKKTEAIDKPLKYGCDFCGREFARETTIAKHICEYKQRWINKDLPGVRIGFQSWVQFYQKNTSTKKTKSYDEFIKSAYYTAFVKFGNHCVDINAINISRYVDWLLKNQIKIDTWTSDVTYTKYLVEYLRTEDALDGVARSVESTIKLSENAGVLPRDILRYGNVNRICYEITKGKISPWMLYQSNSGIEFLGKLMPDHEKMILDYIDPEKWAIKFKREPENVRTVKEILTHGGY